MPLSVPLILRGVAILCGIISIAIMALLQDFLFATYEHRQEKFNFGVLIVSAIITIALLILSFLGKFKSISGEVSGHLVCTILLAMGWSEYLFLYQDIDRSAKSGYWSEPELEIIGYKKFQAKAISTLAFEFIFMILHPIIIVLTVKASSSQ